MIRLRRSTSITLAVRSLVAKSSGSAASRKRLAVQLAGAARDLRRSAARTIQQPANPFFRIDFTTEAALLSRNEVRALVGVVLPTRATRPQYPRALLSETAQHHDGLVDMARRDA